VLKRAPGRVRRVNATSTRGRLRATAARSPLLRKLAGKAALYTPTAATPGANASAWTIADGSLWPIAERYAGSFPLPPISYGTVRDFADSADHLTGLAGASFDMKDLQRCWMVKAILGNVERGSRILEIGAGEPLVAGMLSRLGYEVTVVDDYQGGGNGPREFKRFQLAYPDVHFVRELFPPSEPLGEDFGAVFSISVLEHVPLEQVGTVVESGHRLLGQGGCSIHAVDHVLAGWGAEEHREKLDRIVAALGLSGEELAAKIGEMENDPETYFVSAEAHNQWRGSVPYDSYRMRRIGSVNLFARPS
jgi:SAM-dependent methyltransferase